MVAPAAAHPSVAQWHGVASIGIFAGVLQPTAPWWWLAVVGVGAANGRLQWLAGSFLQWLPTVNRLPRWLLGQWGVTLGALVAAGGLAAVLTWRIPVWLAGWGLLGVGSLLLTLPDPPSPDLDRGKREPQRWQLSWDTTCGVLLGATPLLVPMAFSASPGACSAPHHLGAVGVCGALHLAVLGGMTSSGTLWAGCQRRWPPLSAWMVGMAERGSAAVS